MASFSTGTKLWNGRGRGRSEGWSAGEVEMAWDLQIACRFDKEQEAMRQEEGSGKIMWWRKVKTVFWQGEFCDSKQILTSRLLIHVAFDRQYYQGKNFSVKCENCFKSWDDRQRKSAVALLHIPQLQRSRGLNNLLLLIDFDGFKVSITSYSPVRWTQVFFGLCFGPFILRLLLTLLRMS